MQTRDESLNSELTLRPFSARRHPLKVACLGGLIELAVRARASFGRAWARCGKQVHSAGQMAARIALNKSETLAQRKQMAASIAKSG